MKYLLNISFCIILLSTICCRDSKTATSSENLFVLDHIPSENFVRITVPAGADFIFPDSAAKKEPYKIADFNADGKKDIMVYLGACGTGGCMYGLFLNQYGNYYTLGFLEYLKGAEFETGENGYITIKSFEEVEAYNPDKLHVSVYKFNVTTSSYELDKGYISSSDEKK